MGKRGSVDVRFGEPRVQAFCPPTSAPVAPYVFCSSVAKLGALFDILEYTEYTVIYLPFFCLSLSLFPLRHRSTTSVFSFDIVAPEPSYLMLSLQLNQVY